MKVLGMVRLQAYLKGLELQHLSLHQAANRDSSFKSWDAYRILAHCALELGFMSLDFLEDGRITQDQCR